MPDQPIRPDIDERRGSNSVLIGIALAALIAVLLLFGARFMSGDKNVSMTENQPTTEAPATSGTQQPAQPQ
jgi:hypothetical protein